MTYIEYDDAAAVFPKIEDRNKGVELASKYQSADPFPHIVIDDFLPSYAIEKFIAHFPGQKSSDQDQEYNRAQEKLKSSFNPDALAPEARALFYWFNSRPFISLIENITGIKGLIPDPYFFGGGFHEIRNGGHLSVHADFNHHKPLNLERRINVLIYLNKDWKAEFGGQLELWKEDMSERVHSIIPSYNRCVIFNTTSNSQHGNPETVNHPSHVSRKSIALYYYTSTWDGTKRSHTTQYQVRPGTADQRDWAIKLQELKLDYFPPIVLRTIANLKAKLKKTNHAG